ncbi:MAG: MBOAT family O-acyltransferase [Culicoidibacterales bacterium]
MLFSSLTFLYLFFPLFLIGYFILPARWRNGFLLCSSLVFYAWGEPVYLVLMLFSTVFDYSVARLVYRYREHLPVKRSFIILSLVVNLGLLGFFKYAGFFTTTANTLFGLNFVVPSLALPIGISFYTFQTLSYTLDVGRGQIKPQNSLLKLGTYITLFPQLIAGPIVRYADIEAQLDNREIGWLQVDAGFQRFIIGLSKKVLLANQVGVLWQEISTLPAAQMSWLTAWIGIIAFGLQIYFDFSGYSDMAIGLGRILGFEFLENFNFPYISQSISEFWRRWHISLGTWFREYVYIPLGGNRVSRIKQLRNLLIVWFLTGFWHGANWNFILWGLYFGLIILVEKQFLGAWLQQCPRWLRHGYTLILLAFGWVLFSFEDLSQVWLYSQFLLNPFQNGLFNTLTLYYCLHFGPLLLCCCLLATPLRRKIPVSLPVLLIALLLVTAYLVDDSFNPFLYFRF